MQTFKLDFRNRSAADQLHICEHAVRSITRLKPEERGDVELDKLTATVAGVRTSFDRVIWLRSELKMEIDQRDGRLRAARAQVTSSCSSVSSALNYDPAAMLGAGLVLPKPRSPVGRPAMPDDFRAEPSAVEGEARLRWHRTVRRCMFEVELRRDTDGESGWKHYDGNFRQSMLVKGLESGMKYWVRVRAINAHGKSPWSQPVSVRAK